MPSKSVSVGVNRWVMYRFSCFLYILGLICIDFWVFLSLSMRFLIGLFSLGLEKIRQELVWWNNRRANKKLFRNYMAVVKERDHKVVNQD